MSSRAILFISK